MDEKKIYSKEKPVQRRTQSNCFVSLKTNTTLKGIDTYGHKRELPTVVTSTYDNIWRAVSIDGDVIGGIAPSREFI